MNPDQAYAELVRLSRDETVLSSGLELLQWDAEVCMPRGGVEHRAEQMALLAGLVHDRATDPRYDELLGAVEASSLVSDPESPQAVNVRELRREFDRERRKPRRLVEEWARVTALASQAWADARSNDDFKSFAPWIDQIFALAWEKADAVGWVGDRYDGLLEDYEPGMTTDRVSTLFTNLEADLVPLVASLRDEPAPAPRHVLTREFPPRPPSPVHRGSRSGDWIQQGEWTPRHRSASILHDDRARRRSHRAAVLPAQFHAWIIRPSA